MLDLKEIEEAEEKAEAEELDRATREALEDNTKEMVSVMCNHYAII